MTTFSKTIAAILMFSFSSTVLPMDPQNRPLDPMPWWHEQNGRIREEKVGSCFASLPKELVTEVFFLKSDPRIKNGLRKASKTFAELLSWENMPQFMLCKELCASSWDLKSLIIQNLYQHKSACNNPMPDYKREFIEAKKKELGKCSYTIVGSIQNVRRNYGGRDCESLEVTDHEVDMPLFLFSKDQDACPVDVDSIISPLVIACVSRNPHEVKKCLPEISQESFDITNLDRALHIIIQNNDMQSLEVLLSAEASLTRNEYYKNVKGRVGDLAFELLQLAVFCASDKVIKSIKDCHGMPSQTNNMWANTQVIKSGDFIVALLNHTDIGEDNHLPSIIESHHSALSEKHKDNLQSYHHCLSVVCKDEDLEKFDPSVVFCADFSPHTDTSK